MRMPQPEGMIGNCFDLVGSLKDPAFAPTVDYPVFRGSISEKGERNLQDDAIDILAGLTISAVIDEAIITIRILLKLIAIPSQRTRGQISFLSVVAPLRIIGIEIEQVVAFQLKQRLRYRQFPRVLHRMGHVIELRRIVDRAEKPGEVIKESIVAATNESFDRMAVW